MKLRGVFGKFAIRCGIWVGSSYAFAAGVALILIWALTGPYFRFSDTWQLVINTGTTIITFLMVFVIQYTQNRDTQAINLKLDELLRAVESARNAMIRVEDNSDEKLDEIKKEFQEIASSSSSTS